MTESKRGLEAKDLVFDIRAGMTDWQLMEKYKLSYKGLQSALKKLLNVQALGPEELYERFPLYEVLTVEDMRYIARGPLRQPVPVYEVRDPKVLGHVRDMTDQGLGVKGLEVRVGETKVLVVDPRSFVAIDPFKFHAQCRWVRKKTGGEYIAGFEIIKISPDSMDRLKRFLTELSPEE